MNWEEIERTLLTCDGVGKARKAEVLAQLKAQNTETTRLLEQAQHALLLTPAILISSAVQKELYKQNMSMVDKIRAHLAALKGTL